MSRVTQPMNDRPGLEHTSFDSHLSAPTIKPWASQVVLVVKDLPANVGDIRDASSIPGSGRSPGVGDGNPLQFSCLENSTDRSLTGCSLWGLKELKATEYTHVSTRS